MSLTVLQPMAWTNEKFRLTCINNIRLRQLWKLIALDSSPSATKDNLEIEKENKIALDSENIAEFLSNRDLSSPSKMSLLKYLAINALELSAPASPVLLQQNNNKSNGWVQLSGHPESIIPASKGIVRKRITNANDLEAQAYQEIISDSYASQLVPQFLGVREINGENYIELQDLLYGFKDPNVMDIKMGCRTFLESEVTNQSLRNDLYKKMLNIDCKELTEEEHQQKAITKLRYMMFREKMSSSKSKGFRIEALRIQGGTPFTDLKTIHTTEQIERTILHFLNNNQKITKELIKRLTDMRDIMEKSEFFQKHEIVGSSIFIVYDNYKCGVWLIDFAKSRKLPNGIKVDHRKNWIPGNFEEGLLYGMDELIKTFKNVYDIQTTNCHK